MFNYTQEELLEKIEKVIKETSQNKSVQSSQQSALVQRILLDLKSSIDKDKTVKVENVKREITNSIDVNRPKWIEELKTDNTTLESALQRVLEAIEKKEVVTEVDIKKSSWLKAALKKNDPKTIDYTPLFKDILKAVKKDVEYPTKMQVSGDVKLTEAVSIKQPKWYNPTNYTSVLSSILATLKKPLTVKLQNPVIFDKDVLDVKVTNSPENLEVYIKDGKGRVIDFDKQFSRMGVNGGSTGAIDSVSILSDGEKTSAQNPFPTNGDSIYIKDLIEEESDSGTFTGNVSNLFNGFTDGLVDESNTAIKWFEFHINRPQVTSAIGIVAETGTFSNVRVEFLDRQGNVIQEIDKSSDNTKYPQRRYPIIAKGFCCVKVYFHTTDAVNVNFVRVAKDQSVTARMKLLKPDGSEVEAQGTASGNFKTSIEEFDESFNSNPLPVVDFALKIAQGVATGVSNVNKFGQNDSIGTGDYEDIWDGGGTYIYPADNTAPITNLVSDNSSDTEPIEVQGLDIDGVLVVQTKTLTGTTAVTLDTPLWRVFRLKNVGTTDLIGDVCATNVGDTQDYACINNGNNQTLMALYTIPAGKTGYIYESGASMAGLVRSYSIEGRIQMRSFGSVFQLKGTVGLNSDGNSRVSKVYKVPAKVPEKTDIRISAISSTSNGVMNATFDLILIDNE